MKWILWGTFLFTVPVPYFLVEVGRVPTARLALLSAMTAAAAVAEPDFAAVLIALLFVLHLVVFAALLYLVAVLAARRLSRLGSERLRTAILAFVVTILFVASLFPIYTTPLSRERGQSSLLEIFD